MGMFDEVVFPCMCGGSLVFQSKAGPCELRTYTVDSAPAEVLQEARYGRCQSCERTADLKVHVHAYPVYHDRDYEDAE